MKHLTFALFLILGSAFLLFAQDVQVSRQNKTISVTAEESVSADAEAATLNFGYHNYASSYDAAFRENVSVSDKITQALLDANIPQQILKQRS